MILYNDSLTIKRAFFTYFSFTTYFYIFPLIVLTELLYSGNGEYLFKKVSKILYLFLIFGFLQVLLHQFGISYSYESIFEPGDQNVTNFFGIQILRPNSFFGEPRNFAAVIFPIVYLKKFFVNKKSELSSIDYFLILFLGLLSGSTTFFIYIVAFLIYYVLFISIKNNSSTHVKKYMFILFGLIMTSLFIKSIDFIAPRLVNYINLAKAGAFNPEGDLFYQASDWLILPYFYDIISFNKNLFPALFGYGLGSFNIAIDPYFIKIFNFSTFDQGIMQGSRLLIFTVLLETGLIGFLVFLLSFFKLHFAVDKFLFLNNKSKIMLQTILGSLFIGGIINASFSFIIGYLIIMYYYFTNKAIIKKDALII